MVTKLVINANTRNIRRIRVNKDPNNIDEHNTHFVKR